MGWLSLLVGGVRVEVVVGGDVGVGGLVYRPVEGGLDDLESPPVPSPAPIRLGKLNVGCPVSVSPCYLRVAPHALSRLIPSRCPSRGVVTPATSRTNFTSRSRRR